MEQKERWDEIWQKKDTRRTSKIPAVAGKDIIYRTVSAILKREIPDARGKKILEPGSGHGLVSLGLAKRGAEVSLLDIPYRSTEWAPGRFPTGWDLGVVRGVAHPMPLVSERGELYPGLAQLEGEDAHGEWTLRVRNADGGQAQLNSWSLWLTTAPAE